MEQNNFKLFEVVNETIQDIYDFLIRYVKTFWCVFSKPKKFIELLDSDKDFKTIVRPFNFLLFSFILIVVGLSLLDAPFQLASMAEVAKNGENTLKPGDKVLADLSNLNTTNLIMTFLPSIIVFILLSKTIEWLIQKIFKATSKISYAFIYGIGVSCTSFFFVTLPINGLYQISELFGIQLFYNSLDAFIIIGLVLILYLLIFPAFLIVRILKIEQIFFLKRSIAFLFLLVLNTSIITVYGYIAIDPLLEEERIEFSVLDYRYEGKNITITVMHSDDETYIFEQESRIWLNSLTNQGGTIVDYIDGSGVLVTGKESNLFTLFPPNRIFELELSFRDDSTTNAFFSTYDLAAEYFKVEMSVRDHAESAGTFAELEF